MEVEVKDILDYIGITEVKDIADFKSKFNENHISREMALKDDEIKSKITGAAYGSMFRAAKRTFKDLGAEFDAGEVEDNDVMKLFEVGKTKVSTKLEELTSKAPDADKWQKELAKKDQKLNDVMGLLESTKTKLTEVEAEKVTAVKGVKLDIARKDIFGKLKFSETVGEVGRRGFESIVSEKYKLDIDDETGAAIILDAKTNARIQSPAKSTEFATPEEIFTAEAENLQLLAKANQKSVNLQQQQRTEYTPNVNADGVTRNRIKPANAK